MMFCSDTQVKQTWTQSSEITSPNKSFLPSKELAPFVFKMEIFIKQQEKGKNKASSEND